METNTPIELLKNKLAELKSISGVEPGLILEYEKAILVLEFIGASPDDDKANELNKKNISDSNLTNETKKNPQSYYDRFMEGRKKT